MRRPLTSLIVWTAILVLALSLSAGSGKTPALAASPPAVVPDPVGATCTALATPSQAAYEISLTATQDSYVDSSTPAVNYGTGTTLRVGATKTGTGYRTYIAFDLSALPSDAVILTATLELYQTSATSAIGTRAQLVTARWTESGITWTNQPATSAETTGTGTLGPDQWVRWNITAAAQQWYDDDLSNHGMAISPGIGVTDYRDFSARESKTNRPRLVVAYVRRAVLDVQADTFVSQASAGSNFNSGNPLYVLRNAAGQESHLLLSFDSSGIPAGSTIVSASLGLHPYIAMALQAPEAPQAFSLMPDAILGPWNPSTVTWNNVPGSANQGDPPTAWNDITWNWFEVTAIVQGWSSGALVNYGIKIRPADSTIGTAQYIAIPDSHRAQLIVVYGPEPCDTATGVAIGGATQGLIATEYSYLASISPTDATAPIIYTWQATDQTLTSGSSPTKAYTWATAGSKTITVTVENCGTSVQDTHVVSISEPPAACPAPLTGLTLSGPTSGVTGTVAAFTATPSPVGATLPITYTWEATDQPTYTGSQTTRSYTWATPGLKTVTVTARNCGGEIVQQRTIDVRPRVNLTLSGAWYDRTGGAVAYILANTGGSEAPAGHTTTLYRDGTPVAQATFDTALAPGAMRAGTVPASWACSAASATMRICADTENALTEGSETDNCYEETWSCDLTPPQITSGPTVTNITEHGASITWTTDEPCRSRLDYGKSGPFGLTSVTDTSYRTNHQVNLSGLTSATPYWYRATVEDGAGNLNNSPGAYFETEPPGTDPVTLGTYGLMDYPSSTYEFFTLYADVASDPAGVDRVSFFLDGQLVGRDESPTGNRFEVHISPAAEGFTRADWFKAHQLQIQAYNLEGDPTAVTKSVTPTSNGITGSATIIAPSLGYQLHIDGSTAPAGTTLDVQVYGVEYAWKCTESGYAQAGQVPPGLTGVACSDVRDDVQTMKLLLNGVEVGTYLPPDGVFDHTFTANLAGKSVGTHTLRFRATTSSGAIYTVDRDITLIEGRAAFTFQRSVTRSGNVFISTLTIRNTGTGTAYIDFVDDYARSFQVIETEATNTVVTNSDWGITPDRLFRIDLRTASSHETTLAAGAELTLQTKLVPILYLQGSGLSSDTYAIGSGDAPNQNAVMTYRYAGETGTSTLNIYAGGNWVNGVTIDTAVRQALAAADMLIITSPMRLWDYTEAITWRLAAAKPRELSLVLSGMAELASLRNGVLAFLPYSFEAETLDKLLEPGGQWAEALHPNFRGYDATGYVLFVGEDEVIPSQDAGYGVPYSDLRYASTSGKAKPELVLGRVVGDDLGTLSRALQSAITVAEGGGGFDRQRGLLASGRGNGEGTFWTEVNEADDRLNFAATTRMRWKDYATAAEMLTAYRTEVAKGQSLIFYRGHGGSNSWNDTTGSVGFSAYDVSSFNLNGYHPFVFGLTCLSGDYNDSYSMGEAWLRYGASAFIGAVSPSDRGTNGRAGRGFFNRWGDNNAITVGYSFTDMARDHWFDDDDWKEWIYQYHLYGDPKFGALPTLSVAAAQPTALDGPSGTVQILIPDYVIETDEGGLDHLTIPGGSTWLSDTEYAVPVWKASFTYPQGQRVQAVTLTAQTDLEVATGIHLATTSMAIDCDCAASDIAVQAQTTTDDGWYPQFETDTAWTVTDHPDGTSTLELVITPLTYNPATTDVRFYQTWEFDIAVADTTVTIIDLQPTQGRYRLTEAAAATLVLDSGSTPQDLIVQATVRSLSDELAQALPLHALHAITGRATVDLAVIDALPAGDYSLDVEIVGSAGQILATASTTFAVGVTGGEVTSLTATPGYFEAGDAVTIAMSFRNTGDVTLSGTAVVRVMSTDGLGETAVFTHTLSPLAPGAAVTVNDVWQTTGATAPDYRVLGYVAYEMGASDAREVVIHNGKMHVYLPLAMRD